MQSFLFRSFFQNPEKVYFDGEDPDERILYVIRRSFITNIDWILAGFILVFTAPLVLTLVAQNIVISPVFYGILLTFWYLFTFGFIFQNFINWFFNVYIVTTKRIVDIDFHGILYKNISEAPLSNIEDVTSNISGTFGIVFNVGDVIIQTAAEKREFEFSSVADPSKIRDIISDLITKLRTEGKIE